MFIRTAIVAAGVAVLPLATAAQAGTLKDVQDRGVFRICAHPDALPYSRQGGDLRGFQIDIAQHIADRLGVDLGVDWIHRTRHARNAGCDATMSSIVTGGGDDDDDDDLQTSGQVLQTVGGQQIYNLQQRQRPIQSRPYATTTTRIVVPEGTPPITSLSDLEDMVVAVINQSWAQYVLSTNGIQTRTYLRTNQAIIEGVENGEVDAGVVPDTYYGYHKLQNPDSTLAMSDFVIDPELDYNVAVSLRMADREIVNAVNGILTELREDGTLASVYAKYGIDYLPPS